MLKNLLSRSKSKAGLAPGTIIYDGENTPGDTQVHMFNVDIDNFSACQFMPKDELLIPNDNELLWLRVTGLANIGLITRIGKRYGANNLTLEDILETTHRAKWEDAGDYVFIVMKHLMLDPADDETLIRQISVIISRNVVITFEEFETDEINAVVKRLKVNPQVFRQRGAGYLAYAIMDSLVDNYLAMLSTIENEIENLEDEMVAVQTPIDFEEIFSLKKRINALHRNTKPVSEIVDRLLRSSSEEVVNSINTIYLKDLADHTLHMNDSVSGNKDVLNAIHDENFARTQIQTNKIINVLTIFSVLSIPYVMIGGIYGMNFENMPLLSHKFGFFIALGVMTIMSAGLLFLFRRFKFF